MVSPIKLKFMIKALNGKTFSKFFFMILSRLLQNFIFAYTFQNLLLIACLVLQYFTLDRDFVTWYLSCYLSARHRMSQIYFIWYTKKHYKTTNMESTTILAIIQILNFEINNLIQLFISKFEHEVQMTNIITYLNICGWIGWRNKH